MGVKVVYKNYALVDKNKLVIRAEGSNEYKKNVHYFANLNGLKNDNAPSRLASFEEQYMRSDRQYKYSCWDSAGVENLGYVSRTMCDGQGNFEEGNFPKLNIFISSDNDTASSDGITLHFSPIEEEYATEVEITWNVKDADTGKLIKVTETFYPDKNIFFCPKIVENYTGVNIAFKRWSLGNRWARLYRIDFGREVVYEGDAIFSVSVNESVNLVADQTTVNTSSVVLLTEPDVLFQEQQWFEILYNDVLVARHFVKELKVQGRRVSITGHDVLSKLDQLEMPEVKAYLPMYFESWIRGYVWRSDKSEMKDIPLIWNVPNEIKECELNCSYEKGITRREALTRLCLAAGAYIETAGSRGIVIRSTAEALDAAAANALSADDEAPPAKIIPETDVFSGDSMEYKEPYRSVEIKYIDNNIERQAKAEQRRVFSDSTAKKEFDLSTTLRSDKRYQYLANTYARYYFHTEFYKAKAVIDENINLGNHVLINRKDVFVIQRSLNLDGDKIIADGTYKLVKGG